MVPAKIHIPSYVPDDLSFMAKQRTKKPYSLLKCKHRGVMLSLHVSFFSFFWLIFLCFGSSIALDPAMSTKTITYSSKCDPQQDMALFCGKLVPTLERLELLSEVWAS